MYILEFENSGYEYGTEHETRSVRNTIRHRLFVRQRSKQTSNTIERNPPPRGGFLFTMFSHEEPCVKGPPLEAIT